MHSDTQDQFVHTEESLCFVCLMSDCLKFREEKLYICTLSHDYKEYEYVIII